MNSIKKYFNSLLLTTKLFITFSALIVVTVLILSVNFYRIAESTIKENTLSLSRLFTSEISTQLNSYFDKTAKVTNSLQADSGVLAYLTLDGVLTGYDRVLAKQKMDNSMSIIRSQMPEFIRILCLSSSGRIYSNTNTNEWFMPEILTAESWFQDIIDANGALYLTELHEQNYSSDHSSELVITFGKVLKNAQGESCGILLFDMNPGSLLPLSEEQKAIIQTYKYQIQLSSNGTTFYQYPEHIQTSSGKRLEAYSTIKSGEPGRVSVLSTVSEKDLFYNLRKMRILSVLILCFALSAAIGISYLVSRTIVSPIQKLAANMDQVKDGEYTDVALGNRRDEVGKLADCYNSMIHMIQKLINEVYLSQLQKKNAEYQALQRQIHPHMLYNTLENIRMTAVVNQDYETAEMIQSLGQLFRLTLAKTKSAHCIADELEYIQSYLKVINIRNTKNQVAFHCELPAHVKEHRIIRYIFQPIVENSIIHGFSNMASECSIHVYSEESTQGLTIHIQDNGMGIDEESLAEIRLQLKEETNQSEILYNTTIGIGLKNIADRIRLEYGDEYGLTIESAPFIGTDVSLTIPLYRGE